MLTPDLLRLGIEVIHSRKRAAHRLLLQYLNSFELPSLKESNNG